MEEVRKLERACAPLDRYALRQRPDELRQEDIGDDEDLGEG